MIHVGIDLHQKYSEVCEVSEGGEVEGRCRLPSTESSLRRWFGGRETLRAVVECSGMSSWVSRLLRELETRWWWSIHVGCGRSRRAA